MYHMMVTRSHSDPNDDVIMDDNDRSVPIVTRSVTRTEHQLYEDKQEVCVLNWNW